MQTNHPIDEYLDLVDTADHVIGKEKRSVVYEKGLSNFRVINAFLINTEGKIWTPRRTAHKRMFPLCLDMSLGGHVESGETYEDVFARELAEELNLQLSKILYRPKGHITPHEHGMSAFMNVYEIEMNETPDYNKNDFSEYYWLTPQEILDRIQNGDKAKDDLPKLVKFFYLSKGT